jgi:hypothetical protein
MALDTILRRAKELPHANDTCGPDRGELMACIKYIERTVEKIREKKAKAKERSIKKPPPNVIQFRPRPLTLAGRHDL